MIDYSYTFDLVIPLAPDIFAIFLAVFIAAMIYWIIKFGLSIVTGG